MPDGQPPRPLRADAAANRARVLEAATAAFTEHGLDVALDDIARRAGVGAGTVHRHFPTKAALVDAVITTDVEALAREARALSDADEPVGALCGFLETMVQRGAVSHALAARLAQCGTDVDVIVAGPVAELRAAVAELLRQAREAGGIRDGVDEGSLDALLAAMYAAQVHPDGGAPLVHLLGQAIRTP